MKYLRIDQIVAIEGMKSWIIDPSKCRHCGKLAYGAEDAAYMVKLASIPLQSYECPYLTKRMKKAYHLSSRRVGRVVDASGLETHHSVMSREFESFTLRQI